MILLLIFHMLTSVLIGFSIFYEFRYIQFPESEFQWNHKFGGKFKFLAVQNMFIQFLYFLLAFVQDVIIGCVDSETFLALKEFKDIYYAGLAFPLALFVSINFWTLYFTKREQIFPQIFVQVVPYWHLHVMHTSTSLFVLLEMFLDFREYPEFCSGLVTILTYTLTYIVWLHSIKYFAGFWVYPLFNDKTWKELYTYFGSALVQVIVIYMLGEIFNNAVWSFELLHKDCRK